MKKTYFYIDTTNMNNIAFSNRKYSYVKTHIYQHFFNYLKKLRNNSIYHISKLTENEIEKRIICGYLTQIKQIYGNHETVYIFYSNEKFYFSLLNSNNILPINNTQIENNKDNLNIIKNLERKRKIQNILKNP